MGVLVADGAVMLCTLGSMSAVFSTESKSTKIDGLSYSLISDNVPGLNIGNFGFCTALTQLSGQPTACRYAPAAYWSTSASIMIDGVPALTRPSELYCQIGGCITIPVNETNHVITA